jgi:hypothetical protein
VLFNNRKSSDIRFISGHRDFTENGRKIVADNKKGALAKAITP